MNLNEFSCFRLAFSFLWICLFPWLLTVLNCKTNFSKKPRKYKRDNYLWCVGRVGQFCCNVEIKSWHYVTLFVPNFHLKYMNNTCKALCQLNFENIPGYSLTLNFLEHIFFSKYKHSCVKTVLWNTRNLTVLYSYLIINRVCNSLNYQMFTVWPDLLCRLTQIW